MNKKLLDLTKKMSLFMKKYSSYTLGLAAVLCTVYTSTRCCFFALHQPEIPAEAKKYRKL